MKVTLHPISFTLHPTPYTLHPTPYTLHPTPYALHPTPYTLHSARESECECECDLSGDRYELVTDFGFKGIWRYLSGEKQLLCRNVNRFRGGLVFKAHRLV